MMHHRQVATEIEPRSEKTRFGANSVRRLNQRKGANGEKYGTPKESNEIRVPTIQIVARIMP